MTSRAVPVLSLLAAVVVAGLPAAPPPAVAAARCTNNGVLSTWSLRRLAEQTVVVPVDENHVARVTQQVTDGAGGVILFGSRAPTNLATSLAALTRHAPGHVAPFVMTDEEGGAVQRMANLVGTIPSARRMAATMTAAQIEQLALHAGRRMRAAGVSMDLAPVLDLDGRPGPSASNPDGTRSFSPIEKIAERDGLAFATGLTRAGIVPVAKHFPGLGGATGNTDLRPAATRPWTTIQRHDLLPFAAAVRRGFPAVMVANASVPGLTSLPASLSRAAIRRVLRGRLGFRGLVLTDSLSAGAISAAGFTIPQAAVRALMAGADMVLFGATPSAVPGVTTRIVHAMVSAVQHGSLSRARLQQAALHVLRAKHVTLCG